MSSDVAGAIRAAADKGWREQGVHRQLLWLLAGMVLLWTVLCGVSHLAPDLDGMEELVWAASVEGGYYKHPPFPSWVMYALTSIVGKPVWLTFFAGMSFSALALWFIWRLGCEFTTPRRALIACLMVSATAYFSQRGTIYNHNTVQLWSVAAATWFFYRALRYEEFKAWVWLGVVGGIATLTKYSAMIQFAVFFCFFLRLGYWKHAAAYKGIGAALIAYLLVLSPHLYWLMAHDFQTLHYVDASLDAKSALLFLEDMKDFVLDQLGRISPMIVVWLGLCVWSARSSAGEPTAQFSFRRRESTYAREMSAWDRSFLLWVGCGPFVLTVLVSAILQSRLEASWATTFFMLYGFFAFWWMSGDERILLRRTLVLVASVHVLMAVGYAAARGPLAYWKGHNARSTFPAPEISRQMQKVWSEHVPDTPLRVVVSDTWLGGNIAIHAPGNVKVFINARYEESPWFQRGTALACGALIVYSEATRGRPVASLFEMYQQATWKGRVDVRWSSPRSPLVDLNWGILAPGPDCPQTSKVGASG